MYISNPEKVKHYKCKGVLARYLNDRFPLLSLDEEYHYFAETEELKKCLDDLPMHIKVVMACKL